MYGIMMGCWWFMTLWSYGAMSITMSKRRKQEPANVARWIFHEFKPFYIFPAMSVYLFLLWTDGKDAVLLDSLGTFVVVCWWFMLKNADEDDRWKKRVKKVAGVVKSLGHKLTVVNEGA